MDAYKDHILALVPDEVSILEMIDDCFESSLTVVDAPRIRRFGMISALLAYFIAQSMVENQSITVDHFNKIGFTYLSEDEIKFTFWLLLISNHLHLKNNLIKIIAQLNTTPQN